MMRYRRREIAPYLMIGAMLVMWAILARATEKSLFGATYFNTYTLQAMAWRDGQTMLPHDYPALELAIYQGNYYVSFPPLPSVVLLPLTFLFGYDTPDNALVKLYALAASLPLYCALRRKGYAQRSAALIAFLGCFGSSLLPLTLDGAVWYHAQVLAFTLTVASICCLTLDRMTASLFLYALSVACRPFNALYGIPIFLIYISINARQGVKFGDTVESLSPGVALGLLVAAALGLYNYVRFGDFVEFGHNYLPEFSFQGGTQFSLSHIAGNAGTFLLGLPFSIEGGAVKFRMFGYSVFLACPMLLLMTVWFACDLIKKRMTRERVVVFACFVVHLLLLLTHRTFGGFQLGARYAVDVMPYAFLYLLLKTEKTRLSAWEGALLAAVLILTLFGSVAVHV